jgi:hypothetical protein
MSSVVATSSSSASKSTNSNPFPEVPVVRIHATAPAPRAARVKSESGADTAQVPNAEEKRKRTISAWVLNAMSDRNVTVSFPSKSAPIHHEDRIKSVLRRCDALIADPTKYLGGIRGFNADSVAEYVAVATELRAAWSAIPDTLIQKMPLNFVNFADLHAAFNTRETPTSADGRPVNFTTLPQEGIMPDGATALTETECGSAWFAESESQLERIVAAQETLASGNFVATGANGETLRYSAKAIESGIMMYRRLHAKWMALSGTMKAFKRTAAYEFGAPRQGLDPNAQWNARPNKGGNRKNNNRRG